MLIERNEGECWWELQAQAYHYRYCTYRTVPGFDYPSGMPTGWAIEMRMSGDWVVTQYGEYKHLEDTIDEARKFVETTWELEHATY